LAVYPESLGVVGDVVSGNIANGNPASWITHRASERPLCAAFRSLGSARPLPESGPL